MRSTQPDRCLETCLIGRSRRFVYAYVPKAACTSLKLWMAVVEGLLPPGSPPSSRGGIHPLVKSKAALSAGEAAAIFADPAWFKFSFVRNPLPRLVSAYLDKVVPGKGPSQRLIRHFQTRDASSPWWQRLLAHLRIDAQRSLSFRQLVEQLAREHLPEVDEHFRPQSLLLAGLPLDFVGRVENIQEDFAEVQRRLDTNVALSHQKRQSYLARDEGIASVADWPAARFREELAHPHWRRFYPPDLLKTVEKIYEADFSRFGYRVEAGVPSGQPPRKAA